MNVPNTLTFIRIALTPLFWVMFNDQDPQMQVYGIALFFIASFTDWLDGFYARKFNVVTRLGQFMDPLADKILNLSATYILAVHGYVYWWIMLTIIFRDVFLTIFRFYALTINQAVITSRVAQWKTAIHMLLLLSTLILIVAENLYDFSLLEMQASYVTVLGIAWLIVALSSIYTAVDYIIFNWSIFVKIWRRILKLFRLI